MILSAEDVVVVFLRHGLDGDFGNSFLFRECSCSLVHQNELGPGRMSCNQAQVLMWNRVWVCIQKQVGLSQNCNQYMLTLFA